MSRGIFQSVVIVVTIAASLSACAASNGGEWALAVQPGSTLPRYDTPQQQVITLFEVSQHRAVGRQFFIAGVGYVAFDGGGSTLAGMNRALDPFVELTVADRRDPQLKTCQPLLVGASFAANAVQISGTGYFAALPGVKNRQLAVLRLEKISGCKLVSRR